ncbi:hypothetical protein [Actinoplanes sp. NPDC026619]|uniref:hypothetical protein n=1 Tax=Actinoplanes sp. NPDC026619 TaxID=3155798 RepID=UPI0033C24E81
MWPATAGLTSLALRGRLRAAIITAGSGLMYGFGWDAFADRNHGVDWSMAHVGGEILWVAAALAGAAYRNTLRWRDEVGRRIEQDSRRRQAEAKGSLRLVQEVRGQAWWSTCRTTAAARGAGRRARNLRHAERVAALGGALTAGPGKTGFAVQATIPIAAG